jgi:O-antigen/teichoic acid export membrane protein
MKDVLKGSLILTSSNLAIRVLGYLYRVVAGRMLTPYEFGILNLALPIQYMVILLGSSGIAPTISKFVSECEAKKDFKKRDLVISSSLVFYTIIGIVLGFAFYVFSPYLGLYIFNEERAIVPLKIASIALPFGMLVAVYTGVFQGLKKMEYMGGTLVLEQVLRVVFAVLFMSISLTALYAILGSTLGFIVVLPIAYMLFKKMGLGVSSPSFDEFKKIFRFSLPVSATALAAFVLAYVDILLLGYFLTANEVGIYSAASPTSRLVMAFSAALYAVMLPSVSETVAKKDSAQLKEYIRYAYKLSLAILLPITLLSILLSEQIITVLFGVRYAVAAAPFEILVIGTAFLGIFTLNSGIFQGAGKPGIPMAVLVSTAFLDVLLNLILIPRFEIVGAATASTLSFIFAGVCSTILLVLHLNRTQFK